MNRPERHQHAKEWKTQGAQSLSSEAHRLFLEAAGHHQAKRLPQAEALYDQILTQFPLHPDTLHLRGLLAYQKAQHALALDLIQRAINLDPSKPYYHYNLGLVLEKEKRLEEAIAAYREAITINPQYVEALANLGNVYRRQKRWTDAITTLTARVAAQPSIGRPPQHPGSDLQRTG